MSIALNHGEIASIMVVTGTILPDRNRADGNNQQPTTSEVSNTETVMAGNEDMDTPPTKDTSNVFAAADLSSQLSYDRRHTCDSSIERFSH